MIRTQISLTEDQMRRLRAEARRRRVPIAEVVRDAVDTSAIVAFLDADDPRHADVVEAFKTLAPDELVWHGYVIAESLAVTRRRLGVDATISLLDDILPTIELLPVDTALHARAQQRYRASLPTGPSFVDHVSFTVLERERITTAFALDADFASAGVRMVPQEPSQRGTS